MRKQDSVKVGFAFAFFFAILHALWAFFIAIGAGQWCLNFIFPLHFIDNLYTVLPFSLLIALFLIVMAFIGGFIFGWLMAVIWNWCSKFKFKKTGKKKR